MASEGDYDHSVVLRNLLANIRTGDNPSSGGTTHATDCMAQLLAAAAAAAQFGSSRSSAAVSRTDSTPVDDRSSLDDAGESRQSFNFNPNTTTVYEDLVEIEVPTTVKKRPLCVKFPVDLRKRIIAMRKDGKKCVEVAKELHVSVSGAQKVWERFLATGTVHDRKPSTYAGRPRKYTQNQVCLV